MILSALLHASWNFVAKKYAGNYSMIYLSFLFSAIVSGLISIPFLQDVDLNPALTTLLIATGVFHAVYGFVLTFTYKNGDISTLYPILRGSGIGGAVILSIVLLHESLDPSSGVGVFMVISGIAVLSYKRNREATSAKGIFLAFVCGGLIMSYTIFDKLLVTDIHPIPVLAASQIISVLMFFPYVMIKRREELKFTLRTLLKPVIFVSIVATSSYLIILYVMQYAPVSRIVAVREASVVFGALTGYIILKEDFSKTKLIGVVLVMLGIILVKL
ncbi:MAG: drug/metabolite transporter (DMT)-like permease [Polaribacter sp.]